MPLSIAVAGLTSAEKTALVAAIKTKASALTTAWTIHWEYAEFPEAPDVLLYCPKRDDGKRWAERYKGNGATLMMAALPPLESTPSEVPLFVRMPFKPGDIVETLNLAAKRVMAGIPEESSSAPSGAAEEKVDIQIMGRGISRVDPLVLTLYAVFQGSEKTRFFKIRHALVGAEPVEVWCWPDLGLYWSNVSEEQLLARSDCSFDVLNCQGKRDALAQKSDALRPANALLWRAGVRAFKTAEILPWFPNDQKLSLCRWPDLPKEARTIPMIRIFSKLTRADASFSELLTELKIGRKDLTSVINGLIMTGDLVKAKAPKPSAVSSQKNGPVVMDPDQALFIRALALRCAEALDKSIEKNS